MKVAERMAAIPFSGIRQVFEEVMRREKAGERIINLNIGRPDFDTPRHIKEAAKQALDEGKVHYASNYGISELREALAHEMVREHHLSYDPGTEIVITVGANEGILLAMMGLLNPGDEVLIPDPVWLHYFYCAQMAGAVPVSVPLREERAFVPHVDDFRALITPRTRMLLVNSPHNPTGAVASAEALAALAQLAQEHDLFVLSDEIYAAMVYDARRHVSIGSFPDMKARTVIVNGFSKKYSMTGWRLGWVAAPEALMSAMIRIHQYTTVCATTFAQWGAYAAVTGPQDEVNRMIAEFDRRRIFVYNALRAMSGIRVMKPQGAFYIFPNITGTGKSAEELTQYLLDEAKIALVPGTVFGNYGAGYLRISYANSYDNLATAMHAMRRALETL
jgi:aspartate/methionine/tyrosine aminotransferase